MQKDNHHSMLIIADIDDPLKVFDVFLFSIEVGLISGEAEGLFLVALLFLFISTGTGFIRTLLGLSLLLGCLLVC